MNSHLGEKVEIITKTGKVLVEILKEQNPADEFYNIKVLEGDMTDLEIFSKPEKIHIGQIEEVRDAA
ncbi:MAG: hypothetical protein WCG98_03120 [bacterium]